MTNQNLKNVNIINIKQGYALKKWVEGVSDEAKFPLGVTKKNPLKSVNPTFASEQKKLLVH